MRLAIIKRQTPLRSSTGTRLDLPDERFLEAGAVSQQTHTRWTTDFVRSHRLGERENMGENSGARPQNAETEM